MINRYSKGRRKEYRIMKEEKAKGLLALRSAGSHSPIDLIIIDMPNKSIRLIQCKYDDFPETQKNKLLTTYSGLNGLFKVSFEVL